MWHVFLIIVMKSKMLSATGANSQTPKLAASCHALSVTRYAQVTFPVNEHSLFYSQKVESFTHLPLRIHIDLTLGFPLSRG